MLLLPVLQAATLDASTSLSTTNTPIPLEGGTQNVARQATNGTWAGCWDFGDRNGDGVRDDPVIPAGLSMGGGYLRHNPGTSGNSITLRLGLNGNDLLSTGGYFSTDAGRNVGGISIHAVRDLLLGDGYLSVLDIDGGQTTDTIGDLLIGQTNLPARDVQVAGIARSLKGVGTGGVLVYCSGNVRIQDGGGVARNLVVGGTNDTPPTAGTGQASWTRLEICHQGDFRVAGVYGIIKGYEGDAQTSDEKAVQFDGWWLGSGAPSGSFNADRIDTQGIIRTGTSKALHAPSVMIRNYGSVVIGDVVTRAWDGGGSGNNSGTSGSVTVTNIHGDILFSGEINLNAESSGTGKDGSLFLQGNGSIVLQSLNLGWIKTASFSPGGEVVVQGVIAGTNGLVLVGNGSDLSNAGTALRLPMGKVARYRPDLNPDLLGGSYLLADLAGIANAGGTLAPLVVGGTVFRFQ